MSEVQKEEDPLSPQLRCEERRRIERKAVQARDVESDNQIYFNIDADEASNVTNESGKEETELMIKLKL